jgi:hypothetical protein
LRLLEVPIPRLAIVSETNVAITCMCVRYRKTACRINPGEATAQRLGVYELRLAV